MATSVETPSTTIMHLSWNRHESVLINSLQQLLSSDAFIDVTLCCEGRQIRAHRLLLAAYSSKMKEMMLELPTKYATIIIPDANYQDLEALIQLLYCGQVNLNADEWFSFCRTAELVGVDVDKSLKISRHVVEPVSSPPIIVGQQQPIKSEPLSPTPVYEAISPPVNTVIRSPVIVSPQRLQKQINPPAPMSPKMLPKLLLGGRTDSGSLDVPRLPVQSTDFPEDYRRKRVAVSPSSETREQAPVIMPFDNPLQHLEEAARRYPNYLVPRKTVPFAEHALPNGAFDAKKMEPGSNEPVTRPHALALHHRQPALPLSIDALSHFNFQDRPRLPTWPPFQLPYPSTPLLAETAPKFSPTLQAVNLSIRADYPLRPYAVKPDAPIPDVSQSQSPVQEAALPRSAGTEVAENKSDNKCGICNKTFASQASVKAHQKVHTGEKPYWCKQCQKGFSQLRNYRYHRSQHEGSREFACTCPVCGKTFNDRGYISSHMKIHSNKKEYQCPHCEKRFNQRVAYNMHVRIHTGEKPHECLECGKRFSRKMLLKQHQRTHTGEKPYACEVCGKTFADRSNMMLHQRLHTGIKPYSCHLCDKAFTKNHHLKTHLNHHTGEKPYACSICGVRFSQSSNMRTHFKKCSADLGNNRFVAPPSPASSTCFSTASRNSAVSYNTTGTGTGDENSLLTPT